LEPRITTPSGRRSRRLTPTRTGSRPAASEAGRSCEAAIATAIKESLKGAKIGDDKKCLKDGDDFEYAGYAGNMSLKASSNKRPLVIDRDKSNLTEEDNRIYAGCRVNAIVELWAQNNTYGKRINANLLAVQFYKDDEPFADGEKASINDFDAFDDDEEF
jgi:hypothetical protein